MFNPTWEFNTAAVYMVLATCWVSCLHHEAFDVAVKDAAIVKTAGAEGQKVLQIKQNETLLCYIEIAMSNHHTEMFTFQSCRLNDW